MQGSTKGESLVCWHGMRLPLQRYPCEPTTGIEHAGELPSACKGRFMAL